MSRFDRPPTLDFFATPRPPAGRLSVGLELGALSVEIAGLDAHLADLLFKRYSPYSVRSVTADDALRLRLGLEDRDYYVEPPPGAHMARVGIACDGDRVRYVSYRIAGWFDTLGGEGQALLTSGEYEPVERSMENIVRASVAWQAASRGGALVHAASAVKDGAGYLFYGESGAGKSTLAECSRRGDVVSDDLTLLLPGSNGGIEIVGSPFRGTYEGGAPVQGTFPLRAGFRIIQDERADVRPVSRARAMSELVGNLPFVAEAFPARPDLFARVERSFADVPLAHLHFRKDDSYWDAIAAAGY